MRDLKNDLKRLKTAIDTRAGLGTRWQIAVFVLVIAALFSRGPSFFTHAQFYAEDGTVWFAQAYNTGWIHSLAIPYAGYLSTAPRLGAGLALLVPFRWAPLAMMLVGLLFQALPVPILLSSRCRNWAPLSLRLLFAAIYVAMPNTREIHVVCTNAQWHLAVAEVLLAFATPPTTRAGRLGDCAVFLLGSISGPLSVLLLPFVLVFWWYRRRPWSLVISGVLVLGSVVQVTTMWNHISDRTVTNLGATPALFVRMLGGDVFLCSLFGSWHFATRLPFLLTLAACVLGIGLCVYCFGSVSLEVKLFFIYGFALFAAAIHSPLTSPTATPLWQVFVGLPSSRYWFFPGLPFLFSIAWCAMQPRHRTTRVVGGLLLVALCAGIIHDWRVPGLIDLNFPRYAAAFRDAPAGAEVVIPINLPGWQMRLRKK